MGIPCNSAVFLVPCGIFAFVNDRTFYKRYAYGLSVDWLNSGLKEDILPHWKRLCELREGMIEEMLKRAEKPSA